MIKNISSALLIFIVSACSFMNEKHIYLPIKSSPSGASVYIDGQYFGETPIKVKLEPSKDYRATLVKKGYGSANVDLQTWYSVRGHRDGDNTRCVLDAIGSMLIIPAFAFYSVHCRDFKQKEYLVNIGHNGMGSVDVNSHMNLEIIDRHGQKQNYRREGVYGSDLYNGDYGTGQQGGRVERGGNYGRNPNIPTNPRSGNDNYYNRGY